MLTLSYWTSDLKQYEMILNAEDTSNQRYFKKYHSKDIQSLAQVSKIQLINWTQQGAVIPFEDARGRGKMRIYDFQNLIEVMICRELNRLAIGVHYAKEVLNWLRETKWHFEFIVELLNDESKSRRQELDRKHKEWRKNVPGQNGKKILAALAKAVRKKNNPSHNHLEIFNRVANEIINEADELERSGLKKWCAEYEELTKQLIDSMKIPLYQENNPPKIKRTHTIWECIRLYSLAFRPYSTSPLPFFLGISFDKGNTAHKFILDYIELTEIFKAKASIIINLNQLISEAGEVYEK